MQFIPVTPVLPSSLAGAPRHEEEPGWGCRDWDGSWSRPRGGRSWAGRAAGCSGAAVGEAGCPRARAVPGTPRVFDNRRRALPRAAGHSTAPHGRHRHVGRAPRILHGAKSHRAAPRPGFARRSTASPVRTPSSPSARSCAPSPPGTVTAPNAARQLPWVSQRGYLGLGHTSRDTGLFPVCAESPKRQRQLPRLGCFSSQREPWEPPDDKAVTHPRAGSGRGNWGDTQDPRSSLHPA